MMDDNTTSVTIIVVIFAGVILLRMMKLRSRDGRTLNSADRAQLDTMAHVATRLEQRVNTLEGILDAQVPDWRAGDRAAYEVRR
jgi:phage shock protein B